MDRLESGALGGPEFAGTPWLLRSRTRFTSEQSGRVDGLGGSHGPRTRRSCVGLSKGGTRRFCNKTLARYRSGAKQRKFVAGKARRLDSARATATIQEPQIPSISTSQLGPGLVQPKSKAFSTTAIIENKARKGVSVDQVRRYVS